MVCGGASLGGTQSKASNPTVGLSRDTCLQMASDKNQMRPHKKHKQQHKHHHHGGGAACPSRGVDLMNPCRWRGGRPAAKFSDAVVAGF